MKEIIKKIYELEYRHFYKIRKSPVYIKELKWILFGNDIKHSDELITKIHDAYIRYNDSMNKIRYDKEMESILKGESEWKPMKL